MLFFYACITCCDGTTDKYLQTPEKKINGNRKMHDETIFNKNRYWKHQACVLCC